MYVILNSGGYNDETKALARLVSLWFHFSSMVAQMVNNLPAMKETWIQSLGQEDPLEKGMATHSSILAWKTPWKEEAGGLQSMGVTKSQT